MAKAKRSQSKYMPYPEPQDKRIGIKVKWYYYSKQEDANVASKAAVHNANLQLAAGYDFGYCAPGSIRLMEPGTRFSSFGESLEVGGLYEVCLP